MQFYVNKDLLCCSFSYESMTWKTSPWKVLFFLCQDHKAVEILLYLAWKAISHWAIIFKLCLKSVSFGILTSMKSFITSIKRIVAVLCYKNASNLEGMFCLGLVFHYNSFMLNIFLIFSPLKKVFVILQWNINICFSSGYQSSFVGKRRIGLS